jgi:hypothetical protein
MIWGHLAGDKRVRWTAVNQVSRSGVFILRARASLHEMTRPAYCPKIDR